MQDIFKTRLGLLAATVGSSVGLGNLWKFPYMMGANGSSAFLMTYLISVLLVGFPLLVIELSVGRATRKDSFDAIKSLTKNKLFQTGPRLGLLLTFIVLAFYSVVGGWIIYYMFGNLIGAVPYGGSNPSDITLNLTNYFTKFVSNPSMVIIFHALFILATISITARGVRKGIENFSLYAMAIFYLILFGFTLYSFTLGSFGETFAFLFSWDFAKINPTVLVIALGHAFFTLSVGFGVMITYGAYASDKLSLPRQAWWIVVADTATALIAGIMIFNIAFHYGLQPDVGPNLLMVTMSAAFAEVPFSHAVGFLFFLFVLLAALSSSISLLEAVTAYTIERWKWSRIQSVWLIGGGAFLLGFPVALAETRYVVYVWGIEFFELLQRIADFVTIPALIFVVFVGWFLDKQVLRKELITKNPMGDKSKSAFYTITLFLVRYAVPVLILTILGSELVALLMG